MEMNKTKVAVVGNRKGFNYEYVSTMLTKLKITKEFIIVSGGAEGVDTYVQKYAREIGTEIIIYYPDVDLAYPWRYLERDRRMVNDSEFLIAFNKMDKGGTFYTINYTKKIGKKCIVFNGDDTWGVYPPESIEPKTIKEEKISQSVTKGEQSENKA